MDKIVKYKPSCINDVDLQCSNVEKEAATLDFVSAMFIEKDGAGLDGQLTPEERASVEEEFGKFSSHRAPLIAANKSFFNSFAPIHYCRPGLAKYKTVVSEELGVGSFIGSKHGCGEGIVNKLISQEVFFDLIANPDEWVLFVEGCDIQHLGALEMLSELPYFNLLAKVLDVPIYDPVLPFSAKEVRDGLPEEYGKMEFDVDHCTSFTAQVFVDEGKSLEESVDVAIGMMVEEYAVAGFSIDTELLRKKVIVHLTPRVDESIDSMLERRLQEVGDHYHNIAAPVSNRVSGEMVKRILKKEGRKKALFVIGRGHLPIIKIYQDK